MFTKIFLHLSVLKYNDCKITYQLDVLVTRCHLYLDRGPIDTVTCRYKISI